MGLVVTLQITEASENRMLMTRSRFPKAMGRDDAGNKLCLLSHVQSGRCISGNTV